MTNEDTVMAEEAVESSETAAPPGLPGEDYLKKLQGHNRAKFEEIGSYGMSLDPSSIIMLRLNTLVSMAFSPEDRVKFETRFEAQMADSLDDALKQVRQQVLTQGIQMDGNPISKGSPLLGPDGNPRR